MGSEPHEYCCAAVHGGCVSYTRVQQHCICAAVLLYAERQGATHIGRHLPNWRYIEQYREVYHFMPSCLHADPLLDLLDLVLIYIDKESLQHRRAF